MRKRYGRQFKLMTVKVISDESAGIEETSRGLGIHSNTIRRWLKEYEEYGEVLNALGQAIDRDRPMKGLTLHTDQGAQLTSKSFMDLLKKKEFIQSF